MFSDQFMNKASKMTAINFENNELIKSTLKEVEDDYDVCIIDCSPGRFRLHDNIFLAADLLLVPNTPAPLSVYCNDMLMDSLRNKTTIANRVLSFYNMVQTHKNLHKHYLDNRDKDPDWMLWHFIPFYSDIELINVTHESIFHQLKESKASIYYHQLWMEICAKMQWQKLKDSKGLVVDLNKDQEIGNPPLQARTV